MMDALWSLAGLSAGAVHFALLRWNTQLYLTGDLMQAVGAQLLRLAGIAVLLGMAAWKGALPVLLAAFGVMAARFLVLHMTEAPP